MKHHNFLLLFGLTVALAGYSWSLSSKTPKRTPAVDPAATGIPLLRSQAAEELWHDSKTLFLDVRSPFDYEVGHIAGALSLPEEEIEKRLSEFRPRFERAATIIVYCKNEDCGKSLWAAIRLRNEGFSHVAIYPAGWNDWINREWPSAGAGR